MTIAACWAGSVKGKGIGMRFPSTKNLLDDPERAWATIEPDGSHAWDLASVAHLHRRAGFAAPWAVLQRDLQDGPAASIERLLEGEARAGDGTPAAEFESTLDAMAAQLGPSADLTRIQAIWLYRMIFTPHPLRERMTLFWHNHFATSERQGPELRPDAAPERPAPLAGTGRLSAPWSPPIGKDPAMLIWLDSTINKKAKPNENYAREVMELFTLGRGHYTEKDIQEAARAFTGWFVVRDEFQEVPRQHDDGVKTVLGHTGKWDGRRHPGHPARAARLRRVHLPQAVPPLRERDADAVRCADRALWPRRFASRIIRSRFPWRLILRSNLFFDPSVRRRRVKSPVEFAVGTIRALEIVNPTVQSAALAEACVRMGQSLFAPPSVAGWDGGPGWINSTAMLARANLALGLLSDRRRGARASGAIPGRWPAGMAAAGRESLAGFFIDLLVPGALEPKARQQIEKAATSEEPRRRRRGLREVVRLILTPPEYQLDLIDPGLKGHCHELEPPPHS